MRHPGVIDLDLLLEFAIATAVHAGGAIAAAGSEVHFKADNSPVTAADLLSEALIREALQARFPTHAVVSEEDEASAALLGSVGPLWIVDPLDGSLNLLHRRPHVAVSIAFAVDGVVQVGVAHNPFGDETYSAIRGRGAFRNGTRIYASGQSELRRALIGTGLPHDRSDIDPVMRRLRALALGCQDIRRLGSPVLDICHVADGRLDGFCETLFPWDVAAAGLIAEEAEARRGHLGSVPETVFADLYGEEFLVASPGIFEGLAQLLRNP